MRGLCWSLVAMTVHRSMSSTIPWEAGWQWFGAKKHLVLHKIETRNNNGTFPPSSSIFLCFTSCLFSTWLKTPIFCKRCHLFWHTRLCDQRGCTAGACGSEWSTENLQILWRWATSRGAQKNSSRGEVRCVFDVFFFFFVVLTSVDHNGRLKSIAFLLVFSCPIDEDFLIQFLVVQRFQKS